MSHVGFWNNHVLFMGNKEKVSKKKQQGGYCGSRAVGEERLDL